MDVGILKLVDVELARLLKRVGYAQSRYEVYGVDDAYKLIRPTLDEVICWLYEEKKVFIEIRYHTDGFHGHIHFLNLKKVSSTNIVFQSPNDCKAWCVKKAVENYL